MARMKLPRSRLVSANAHATYNVPWVARVRSPWVSPGLRAAGRIALIALLTLAFDSVAYAQAPSSAAPDAVPVVSGKSSLKPAPKNVPASSRTLLDVPHDLRKVSEWIDYRAARHIASMPTEARIFYRRGLNAKQAGQDDEALVDVRGAAELDPLFVEPHLTIAAWMATREPSQALLQYANVIELLRQDFNLQLELVANSTLLFAQALFVGLLLAAMCIVFLRREDLSHGWSEELGRHGSRASGRIWGWGLLILPYFAGFGLMLPTLGFLGVLWPNMRIRERVLGVMLLLTVLLTPLALSSLSRFSLTLHEDQAPFYGITGLENQPYGAEREQRLAELAARHHDDGLLQFGLGWTARRGNHLPVAEHAYRRALELWPNDSRVLNDLGNVLAMQGHADEALDCYRKATSADPQNAAAWFNTSQLLTQRYDYQAANDALSRASAINFELVKDYQSQATNDGLLVLVDQWLTPKVFWDALRAAPLPQSLPGSLPVALRGHLEASGWGFSVLTLIVTVLGLFLGRWQQKALPMRACSNCGSVVCRRCATRRREHALCPTCTQIEAQAESPEFSRVLLLRHRQSHLKRYHWIRTGLSALVPGFGLLAHRRVFTAVLLLAATWLVARLWIAAPPPFAIEPRLTLTGQEVPVVFIVAVAALVYLISIARYFQLCAKEHEREAALASAGRGRITQSTRRVTPAAA